MPENSFEKMLSEKGFSESDKKTILEAWNARLAKAEEEISSRLKETYTKKFDHDKDVLVETFGKYVEDELQSLARARIEALKEKQKYNKKITEHAKLLEKNISAALKAFMTEEYKKRKQAEKNIEVLESFVLQQLSDEILEFQQDKLALKEEKLKIKKQGEQVLREVKEEFLNESSKKIIGLINETLKNEISELKEDIIRASENEFGREIFESFSSTFLNSHYSEGKQIKKYKGLSKKLTEAINIAERFKNEAKRKDEDLRRTKIILNLTESLSPSKRKIMENFLRDVSTDKLEEKFNQYLPVVLGEAENKSLSKNSVLEESVYSSHNGDRQHEFTEDNKNSFEYELQTIKKLAGL